MLSVAVGPALAKPTRGYVLGNFMLWVFVSSVSAIAFFLLQVPYWPLVGPVSAFFSLVPYVGLPLSIIPPVLAALGDSQQVQSGGAGCGDYNSFTPDCDEFSLRQDHRAASEAESVYRYGGADVLGHAVGRGRAVAGCSGHGGHQGGLR